MARKRKMMNQINVVPYIDVMLVLLVIFMVTAPMQPAGTVDLPSMSKASQVKSAPLEIEVSETNLKLRDRNSSTPAKVVSADDMLAQIQAARLKDPEQAVVIAAGKGVRYDSIMKVMDLLQRNQIGKVGLLVQPTAQ